MEAVERSELCLSIPMFGKIESLNLGTVPGLSFTKWLGNAANIRASIGDGVSRGKANAHAEMMGQVEVT